MSEISPIHDRKKLSLSTKITLGVLTLIGVGFQTNKEVHSPNPPVATVENPFSWAATPIADIITKVDGRTYGVNPDGSNLDNNQQQEAFYQAAEKFQEVKK